MASWYYPLENHEPLGIRLLDIIAQLEQFLVDAPHPDDNDQIDNAAIDAAYREDLYIALRLMKECVKK